MLWEMLFLRAGSIAVKFLYNQKAYVFSFCFTAISLSQTYFIYILNQTQLLLCSRFNSLLLNEITSARNAELSH